MHVLVASTYVAAHGNVRTPGAPRAKLRQRARLSRAEAADALKKVCAPLAVVGFLGARACFAPCAASARSECAPAFSRAPGVDECACQAWSKRSVQPARSRESDSREPDAEQRERGGFG